MKISFKSLAFVLFAFHGLTILLGAQESESLESLEQKFNDLEKRVSRFLQSDADTGEEAPATPPEAPSSQPVPALPEVPSPQVPAPAPPLPGTPPSQENDNQAQADPIFTPVPQGDAGQDPADSSSPSDFDSLKESLDTVVRELEKSKEIISELTESGELDGFSSDLSPDLTAPSPIYSSSHEGRVGAYYTGLGYAYNYDTDNTEWNVHSLFLYQTQPINDFIHWGFGVDVSMINRPDTAGWDDYGNIVKVPSHTAYEVGANLLLGLNKQFNFQNRFINSIDPYVFVNAPIAYEFENEYKSDFSWGWDLGIGIEIMFFDTFSILPCYGKKNREAQHIDSVYSTTRAYEWEWRGIDLNYFFDNGGFLALEFYQNIDSSTKGINLIYAFNYN